MAGLLLTWAARRRSELVPVRSVARRRREDDRTGR
jgi:hypothetical protein